MRKRILLVCTGNTCRSSMAEGLLKKMLTEAFGPVAEQYEVRSAGVAASPGDKASAPAVEVMAEAGIDLSGHQATRLTPDLAAAADLVLTMTAGHKQAVLQLAPTARTKTFTLKEYVRIRLGPDGEGRDGSAGGEDIADPYGAETAVYRSCAGELQETLERLIQWLQHENGA